VEVLESKALKFGGEVGSQDNIESNSIQFAKAWVKSMEGIEN
jgi:hypothetical protein